MLISCTLPECREQGFCGRNTQKRLGELQRVCATIKADYSNTLWPLEHPPTCITREKTTCISNQGDASSGITLPDEILVHVMGYLDKQTLLCFATCKKTLSSYVTKRMVVKAALCAGGKAKTSIIEICRLEKKASIYPPSPMRLLRLLNGKKCEICLKNSVAHVRLEFGNFVCWDCIVYNGHTKLFKKGKANRMYSSMAKIFNGILNHKRVASKSYDWRRVYGSVARIHFERSQAIALGRPVRTIYETSMQTGEWGPVLQIWDNRAYMWCRPHVDRLGERVGPIVTYNDIYDITKRIYETVSKTPDGTEDIPMLQGDYTDNARKLERVIDKHITGVIQAPAPDDPQYKTNRIAHAMYLPVAKGYWHLKKLRQNTATCNWRANKLANTIKAVQMLSDELDHPASRELLLYEINTEFMCHGNKKTPSIFLHDKAAQGIMLHYLINPSKMRFKGVLQKLAKDIDNLRLLPPQPRTN